MTDPLEFEPLDDLRIDDLDPEEYLLLLDWCLVNDQPFAMPDLAWHVQYSLTFRQELFMWRILQRAEREMARRWWRRLWRWCWKHA